MSYKQSLLIYIITVPIVYAAVTFFIALFGNFSVAVVEVIISYLRSISIGETGDNMECIKKQSYPMISRCSLYIIRCDMESYKIGVVLGCSSNDILMQSAQNTC